MKNILFITICLIFTSNRSFAQSKEQIDALNLYVEFLNESVHGLFTAHALLVISNKEVNKYVDLDSYSLNNLTNNEVQSNLFEKSDKENYTTFQGYSPLQLLELAKQNSSVLKPAQARKLNALADEIGTILNRINSLRFEIVSFIESHDLNEKESVYGVYEILEECALMFDRYAQKQREMVAEMGSAHTTNRAKLFQQAQKLHRLNKSILYNLRSENVNPVKNSADEFTNAVAQFDGELKKYNGYNEYEYRSYVKNRLDSIAQHLVKFGNSSYVPKAYKIYGKAYYYHNQIAKRFFNWSGPGYVRYLNGILSELDIDFVNFTEEPLIFKVVYPMKLDEMNALNQEQRYMAHNQEELSLPQFSEGIAQREPPKYTLSFKIFDHHMNDRDSISLYLNGECILDKYNLQSGTKEFEVDIKQNQDYELQIKAENNGIIAPNTAAIGYRISGTRKRHIIECRLFPGETKKVVIKQ